MSSILAPAHRHTAPPATGSPVATPRVPAAVRWVARVLAWMVTFGSLAVLVVAVLVPRIGGATPYEVLTGSMRPVLPPGTLVVVKPVADPSDIGVGTVVTYQLRSGEPAVVTHRVIRVETTLTGQLQFITQGDANPAPDALPVRPEQIRGKLWYAVPQLGRANDLLNGDTRQLLVYVAAGGLGLYALGMYVSAARDRVRRTEEDAR